jgi:hypothetical protein
MSLAAPIPPPYEACPFCGAEALGIANMFADSITSTVA